MNIITLFVIQPCNKIVNYSNYLNQWCKDDIVFCSVIEPLCFTNSFMNLLYVKYIISGLTI